MKIKTFGVILLSIVLTSCQNTANWSTIDFLHGEWEGAEITNYIKIAGFPGALTPHSIAHLTNTIDSVHKSSTIDSLGTTIDQSTFNLVNENTIVFTGTDATIDWAFDQSPLPASLQPIFDSLRVLFSGKQQFDIQVINKRECVLYFDTVVPVYYAGDSMSVELRHTQYWKN